VLPNGLASSVRVVWEVLTGLQLGGQLVIPLPPLPSSNLRLIQALQPWFEQNQRSPTTGLCMTGPWLLQIAVDYGNSSSQ
jgi:hypothetical protein